jgi:hypothetical protein
LRCYQSLFIENHASSSDRQARVRDSHATREISDNQRRVIGIHAPVIVSRRRVNDRHACVAIRHAPSLHCSAMRGCLPNAE